MALSSVFHEFGVPLDGELYREIHHTDTYDDQSLHRMGYRFILGRWTRRISGQEADSDLDEDEIRAAKVGPSERAEAGPSGIAADGTEDEPFTPPPAGAAPPPDPKMTTMD